MICLACRQSRKARHSKRRDLELRNESRGSVRPTDSMQSAYSTRSSRSTRSTRGAREYSSSDAGSIFHGRSSGSGEGQYVELF